MSDFSPPLRSLPLLALALGAFVALAPPVMAESLSGEDVVVVDDTVVPGGSPTDATDFDSLPHPASEATQINATPIATTLPARCMGA